MARVAATAGRDGSSWKMLARALFMAAASTVAGRIISLRCSRFGCHKILRAFDLPVAFAACLVDLRRATAQSHCACRGSGFSGLVNVFLQFLKVKPLNISGGSFKGVDESQIG